MKPITIHQDFSVRELCNIPNKSECVQGFPDCKRKAEINPDMWIVENTEGPFKYAKVWQAGLEGNYMKQEIPLQPCLLPLLDAWMDENAQ